MRVTSHLIRRSQARRALRDMSIINSKLKIIRDRFNNFSYHRRLVRDAEERESFCERVIMLLLTLDDIEGGDLTVRSTKRSMVNEMEPMLDVIDPQYGQPKTDIIILMGIHYKRERRDTTKIK